MDAIIYIFVGLFGACLGSLNSVLVYRLPRGVSVNVRSHCVACRQTLPWYVLIPVISYLMVRGECLQCRQKIPAAYWIREVLLCCLCLFIYYAVGWSLVFFQMSTLGVLLLTAAEIDVKHGIVPNRLVGAGALLGLLSIGFITPSLLLESLLAASAVFVLLLGIARASYTFWGKVGLGMGDIKLIAMIALFINWQSIWAFYLAAVLGGLFGLTGIAAGWLNRQARIPFAPFIAMGVAGAAYIDFWDVMSWFV